MHELMLQHHLKGATLLRHHIGGRGAADCIDGFGQSAAHIVSILASFGHTWPLFRRVGMLVTFAGIDIGIDAAAKQIVKIGIERLPLEKGAADLIPGKCRQVTDIKKKWMPPDDRSRTQFGAWQARKNLIRARPYGT